MLLQLTRKVVAPRPLNRAAAADRYRTHANGQYQVTANVNEVA